jgi:hypothetical protein
MHGWSYRSTLYSPDADGVVKEIVKKVSEHGGTSAHVEDSA